MLLIIDNYDSFTYNLVQYFGELGAEPVVKRNDEITVAEIEALKPEAVVISPGPCTPKEAGISNEVIAKIGPKLPVLGVCLGHQCIGHVYGGAVVRAGRLMHGKTSPILHDDTGVFAELPCPFEATRYHSLIIDPPTVPDVAHRQRAHRRGRNHGRAPSANTRSTACSSIPSRSSPATARTCSRISSRITSDFHAKKKAA